VICLRRMAAVREYGIEIINTYPHAKDASTEGLFYLKGFLYEGTAPMPSPNPSSVRKVELETGKVLQKRCLPKRVYGEGIVNWKDRLIQITYNQGAGFIYGLDEFDLRETFRYKGQGWGLTQDGRRLIVSDGTNKLQFWDPKTLKKIGSIRVVDVNRSPVHGLNALQWVKGEVWANVNNWVARINPRTGKLTSWFDLSVLFDELTCEERKNVGASRMDLSCAFRMPIANRQPWNVVSISTMPNIFMPSFDTAYSSRTGAICRSASVLTSALTTSACGTGRWVAVPAGVATSANCSRVSLPV